MIKKSVAVFGTYNYDESTQKNGNQTFMLEYVEWQLLMQDWANALSKARVKEAVIADRMNSFLKGNGCLPSPADIEEVEALWEVHVEKRKALNQYIAKVVYEFSKKDQT